MEQLNLKHIILASNFMAKKDVRYYLLGINLTKTSIVASNGHYLCDIKSKVTMPDDIESIIVPQDTINFFIKKLAGYKCGNIEVIVTADQSAPGYFYLEALNVKERFQAIDSKYPNFEKLTQQITLHDKDTFTQYNWEYLALAQKSIMTYQSKTKKEYFTLPLKSNEQFCFFKDDAFTIVIMANRI